jgi:hypothetical protein
MREPLAELVVDDVRGVVRLQLVVIAADAVDEAAGVIAVLHHLAGGLVRIDHLGGAVPGVERELRHIGVDLATLDRDGAGPLDDLAQRTVEPVPGAGAVGDVSDAPDHVADQSGLALRGGPIGVGDVVGRERRIVDRRHPVEAEAVDVAGERPSGRARAGSLCYLCYLAKIS